MDDFEAGAADENIASTAATKATTSYLWVILVPIGLLVTGIISMIIFMFCHYCNNTKKQKKPCARVLSSRADIPKQPPSRVKNVYEQNKQPAVVKQTSEVRVIPTTPRPKNSLRQQQDPVKKVPERKSVAPIPKKIPVEEVVDDEKLRSKEKVVVPLSLKSLPEIMRADKTTLGDLGGVSVMREDLSMKTLLKEVDTQAMPRIGRAAYAKIIDEIFDQQAQEEAKQLQKLPVKSIDLLEPRVSIDLGRSVIYVVPSEFTQESETTQSSPVPFSDSLQEQEPMFPSGRVIKNAEQPDGEEK